jgi:hypothetical protein
MDGIIPFILPAHILAGALALPFGYVTLAAAKGAKVITRVGAPPSALRT